jgi:hypothetical protein
MGCSAVSQKVQREENSQSWVMGEEGFAEDAKESLRSKLPPYGLLSSSFHMARASNGACDKD